MRYAPGSGRQSTEVPRAGRPEADAAKPWWSHHPERIRLHVGESKEHRALRFGNTGFTAWALSRPVGLFEFLVAIRVQNDVNVTHYEGAQEVSDFISTSDGSATVSAISSRSRFWNLRRSR